MSTLRGPLNLDLIPAASPGASARVKPTHPCAGGCGAQIPATRKVCAPCSVELAQERHNSRRRLKRRAKG